MDFRAFQNTSVGEILLKGSRLAFAVAVIMALCLCQQCPPSSVAFILVATPSCLRYGLCFRGHHSGDLPCPARTAFDAVKGGCTAEAFRVCTGQKSVPHGQTHLFCPVKNVDTFYPDYTQGCPSSNYFRCQKGVMTPVSCSEGLVFDEGTDTCVQPSTLSCGVTGPVCATSMAGRRGAVYANYTQGCPTSRFEICTDSGEMTGQSCPYGLYYNGAIKSCDYIDNILCIDISLAFRVNPV